VTIVSARKEPMNLESEMLTVGEAASYLRVSVSTVYRLVKFHDLPGFKVGSDWRFHRATLQDWMIEKQKTSRTAVYPTRTKQ
jgi:excisionase family DNA binding protein